MNQNTKIFLSRKRFSLKRKKKKKWKKKISQRYFNLYLSRSWSLFVYSLTSFSLMEGREFFIERDRSITLLYQLHDPHNLFHPNNTSSPFTFGIRMDHGSTWEGKRIEMELKLVPLNALKVLQREPCLRIILHHVTALVDLSTL